MIPNLAATGDSSTLLVNPQRDHALEHTYSADAPAQTRARSGSLTPSTVPTT